MDVFVIPVARDRYELYCEPSSETDGDDTAASTGPIPWWKLMARVGRYRARIRYRFSEMLKAAEQRQHQRSLGEPAQPRGWAGRVQDQMMAWVVERIAEQRLLWNLRKQTMATAAHPQDMTFEQVMTLIRRTLQRDYDRHRRWLVIDALLLIISGALALVPGPNVLAYYFIFRVWGHWLSMRGARQGLDRIEWSGRGCAPLTELRGVAELDPPAREQRIHDIAARLRLQHLSAFFERIAPRHA